MPGTPDETAPPHTTIRVSRAVSAACVAVTLVLGVASRLDFVPHGLGQPLGVALWCTLVYWLVLVLRPGIRPRAALLTASAIGIGVELFQTTGIPRAIASEIALSRWVLGAGYETSDLPMYPIGALLAWCVHATLRRRPDTTTEGSPSA